MNENSENENRNFETTVSLKRSSSILKTGENENQKTMMYGDETMAFSEMTNKTKKIRRVSFSARIQVKTIDESLSDLINGQDENQKASEKSKTSSNLKGSTAESTLMDISNQVSGGSNTQANKYVSEDSVLSKSQLSRAQEIQKMEAADMSLLSSPSNMNRTEIMCQTMDFGNNTTYQCLPDDSSIMLGNATIGGSVSMNVTSGDELMLEQGSNVSTMGMSLDDQFLMQTGTNITATMMTMTMAQTRRLQIMKPSVGQNCEMEAEISHEAGRLEHSNHGHQREETHDVIVEQPADCQSRIEVHETNTENKTVEQDQITQQSNSVLEISSACKSKNMTYEMSLMNNQSIQSIIKMSEKSALMLTTNDETTSEESKALGNMTVTLSQEKSIVNQQNSNKTYDVSVAEVSRRSNAACETYVVDNASKVIDTTTELVDPNGTRVISTIPAVANNTYSVQTGNATGDNSIFAKPIDMSDSIALVGALSMQEKEKSTNAEPAASAGIQHETIIIDSTRFKSMSPNKPNSTVTIHASEPAHMLPSDECFNMSNITASNLSRLIDNFNTSALLGTNSHMNKILCSTAANAHCSQMNGTVDLTNATFDKANASIVELAKPHVPKADILGKYMNESKALKEMFIEKLNNMKEYKAKLEESVKKLQEENNLDEQQERIRKLKTSNEQEAQKIAEKRNEMAKLMLKIVDDTDRVRVFIFQESMLEKSQAELKNFFVKNQSLEKEYKETSVLYEKLKEKVEDNSSKIKSLQEGQKEKEKVKSLYEKLFSDAQLPFKMTSFENDTIKLSFFYDMIHLDIKVPNTANYLSTQLQSNIRDLNQQQHKYLNYPIQQLFFRSSVDKNGTLIEANSSLKKVLGSKVPLYLRYCIDLILGEIGEGDLMTVKKRTYKYVKDLPILITHINLACKSAINLAKDFEYFGTKTTDTNIKCDFDFKNHLLNLELPSVEDACYFRLKLKVLPGAYYQQPIEFTIESIDGSYFLPNTSRLTSLINNQYFEDGSFRSYLKKLNLF